MNNKESNVETLIQKIEQRERTSRRRAIVFSLVPIIIAVILLWFTGQELAHYSSEKERLTQELENYNLEKELLTKELDESLRELEILYQDIDSSVIKREQIQQEIKNLQAVLKKLVANLKNLVSSEVNNPSEFNKLVEEFDASQNKLKNKGQELEQLNKEEKDRLPFTKSSPNKLVKWTTSLSPVKDEFLRSVLKDVISHEGGWADYFNNPGLATNYGITLVTLRRLFGADLTKNDLKSLTQEQAISIYERIYFRSLHFDKLPRSLWLAMIDAAVNSGSGRAIKWLQSVCVDEKIPVDVDGFLGQETIDCVEKLDKTLGSDLIRKLVEKRLAFLKSLSTWSIFGRGWERRITRLLPSEK